MFVSSAAKPSVMSAAPIAATMSQRPEKRRELSDIPLPHVVSNVSVAAHTGDLFISRLCAVFNRIRNWFVTITACVFGYFVILWGNAQRVGKTAGSKIKGVPESVSSLDLVLAEQIIVRCMTIVAAGDRVVTRLRPGRVMFAHDVTIRARRRIVREIGTTLGVNKGERADPDGDTQQYDCNRQQPSS